MNLKFVFLWLVLAVSSIAAVEEVERELPRDRVLPLKAQEELFVKAYEEVGPTTLNPLETIIPGLAPMVRMHYSYVRGLVEHSPEHLGLLKQFWQATSRVIEDNKLTIGKMSAISLQLGILLSEMQGKKFSGMVMLSGDSQKEGDDLKNDWKQLDSYKAEQLYGTYPYLYGGWKNYYSDTRQLAQGALHCVAVLCNKSGGFSFDRFDRNYLERPVPLSLVALSLDCLGPHGGNVGKTAAFVRHEFTHWLDFASSCCQKDQEVKAPTFLEHYPLFKERSAWEVEREFLRRIYRTPDNQMRNQAAIFLLLHEKVNSFMNNTYPWLGEETTLPLSERRLFWNLVSSARAEDHPLKDVFLPMRLGICVSLPFDIEIDSVREEGDKTHLETHLEVPNVKGFISKTVGRLSFDVTYVPTEHGETQEVSNISSIHWDDSRGLVTESQKKEFEQAFQTGFSQPAETLFSRSSAYRQFVKDEERLLRSLGYDLPPEEAPLSELTMAVHAGMERFWQGFYVENKELFSVEPF